MNAESNSKVQGTRPGKPTSYKRAHRANNRPSLVTSQAHTYDTLDAPTAQAIEESLQPASPAALEVAEPLPEMRKRQPGFFSNISRTDAHAEKGSQADPAVVRMARAMRGKIIGSPKEGEIVTTKKTTANSPKANAVPQRPRSGFKTRYIWGMMGYLLVADFLGIWIQSWMISHHLDGLVFTLGPFKAMRSTLIFLALLIILLIVLARFDLIPSSLKAMAGGPAAQRGAAASKNTRDSAATFEARGAQPTRKQGVQGQHDDLYQEYRENQRYFQKRDRKR